MKSIWSETEYFNKREPLTKDIKVNTVIVGGGIAGILTAYLLNKKGIEAVIIDKGRTASGNIKNTTAKITSQHDLIYAKIKKEFGIEKAIQYAKANELAIKVYREIIAERNIECDFEEKAAYVYSLDETKELKEEVEAAKESGIDAEFVETSDLPFKIEGAVKFNGQAQFNPLKFLKNISEELVIYENTRAIEIGENEVVTDRGKIVAENIVVASHYPIMNMPGFYFMKMHQERSYVLGLENVKPINGMYIDYNKDGYSFRSYKDLILFGGNSHRTGENKTGGNYESLKIAAKEIFPKSTVKYEWSAQDCMTIDSIPYIGHYSKKTPNIYVETGFNKWGMTSSMVSAIIVSDMIAEKENDFSDIFSPARFDLSSSIKNIAKDISETSKNFIAQKIYIPDTDVLHIEKGHAGIVEFRGEKAAVYKDEEGHVYAVSTKCSHLGCQLQWNADELTWDCPCHGSRFDYKGRLIDGPAVRDIR